MNQVIKVTKRLIDSVWTISYVDLGENRIELIGYNREDPEGYNREHELGKGCLLEEPDSGRIVIGAIIDGVEKVVVNPQHIFSYKG